MWYPSRRVVDPRCPWKKKRLFLYRKPRLNLTILSAFVSDNGLAMTTEDVYSAVLQLFKSRSLQLEWRVVVESHVRIILEKRLDSPESDLRSDSTLSSRPRQKTTRKKAVSNRGKGKGRRGRLRRCPDQPPSSVKPERLDLVDGEFATHPIDTRDDWIKDELSDLDLIVCGGEWRSEPGRASPRSDASPLTPFPSSHFARDNHPPVTKPSPISPKFIPETRFDPYVALFPCDDIVSRIHDRNKKENDARSIVRTDGFEEKRDEDEDILSTHEEEGESRLEVVDETWNETESCRQVPTRSVSLPSFAQEETRNVTVNSPAASTLADAAIRSPSPILNPPSLVAETGDAVIGTSLDHAPDAKSSAYVDVVAASASAVAATSEATEASDVLTPSNVAVSAAASSLAVTTAGALPATVAISAPKKKRLKLDLPRGSYYRGPEDQTKIRTHRTMVEKKPCPHCKKTDYGNKYLRTHVKRCHPELLTEAEKEEEAKREVAERTCNICSKTLTTKGGFNTHMKEIHLRDSLEDRTCPVCGKELSSRRRREEHIAKSHQADRVGGPFPCVFCSKLFATKEQVRSHIRFTCPMKRTAVECPICGRKYLHEEGIRYHLLTEHEDAGYKPENERDLKLLSLKATCYVCGKEMKRFSLKHHIAHVHQGIERSLKCKKCDLTMSSPALHRRHMREVHKETPTPKTCQKCHKSFSSYHGLKNHMRGVHMGIRYQCELCPSSFFSKKDMKEHVSSVHLGNKHQCPHCPRDFNRRSELNRHKRNIHHIDTSAERELN